MGVWDGRESCFPFNLPNKSAQSVCFTIADSYLFCPFIFIDLLPPFHWYSKEGGFALGTPAVPRCFGSFISTPAWIPGSPVSKLSVSHRSGNY